MQWEEMSYNKYDFSNDIFRIEELFNKKDLFNVDIDKELMYNDNYDYEE